MLIIVAQGQSLRMLPCPLDRDSTQWIIKDRRAMVYYLQRGADSIQSLDGRL